MAGIRLDQRQQEVALAWGQRIGADTLVGDNDIVLKRHRLLAPIRGGIALRRQVSGDDGLEENRLLLLWQGERANELQTVALLGIEFPQPGVGAAVSDGRLRAPERRRHHDLVLAHEVVQVEVVAVKLPTPRLVHRGRAKEAEEIEPFPKKLPVAGNFPKHLVELHDVARGVESPYAQARPEQLQSS